MRLLFFSFVNLQVAVVGPVEMLKRLIPLAAISKTVLVGLWTTYGKSVSGADSVGKLVKIEFRLICFQSAAIFSHP